jgi:hypothetical protein
MSEKMKKCHSGDPLFLKAFAIAKEKNGSLQFTQRQYRRWTQMRGQAYACRNEAQAAISGN